MTKLLLKSLCFLCFLANIISIPLQADEQNVQAELIHEHQSIQPGTPFFVGIHLKIADHWHTYWKNPGDAGMASSVEWTLPDGFTASPIIWPTPEKFSLEGIVGYGYEHDVLLLTRITPPQTLSQDPIDIHADIRWLVCSDSQCVPGQAEHSVTIPVTNSAPEPHAQWSPLFDEAKAKLPVKQMDITVHRTEEEIHVHLQLPEGSQDKVAQIHFIPEEGHAVDHKSKAELQSPDKVVFKLGKEGTSATELKGIMVGKNAQNETLFAMELHAPITADNSELISAYHAPKAAGLIAEMPQETENAGLGLGMALLMALVGGAILNLMPCVLPIVSLKVFSFIQMSGQGRTLTLKHGFAFFIGVIISFWVLAGVLLILKAYGTSVGWGFQLQEPIFVALLATLLLAFSLSMFGVFEMGGTATEWAGKMQTAATKKNSLKSSFFSGVLATAVATPCTGPFLGTAVGFAFTVPALQALLIFTFLGMGMALPYLILAAYPALLKFIPKPGAWMETFKNVMGFLMIASVIWLAWVFSAQMGSAGVILLLVVFFWVSIACWIYGQWGSILNSKRSRMISYVFISACLVAAGFTLHLSTAPSLALMEQENLQASLDGSGSQRWIPYSPEMVKKLQSEGTPVFIDFTAKWCLICQVNHLVLTGKDVEAKFDEMGVVRMKADWTRNDPIITEALKQFGRSSVPLYVLYGTDPEAVPQILPQVLTPEIVLQSLEKIEVTHIGSTTKHPSTYAVTH